MHILIRHYLHAFAFYKDVSHFFILHEVFWLTTLAQKLSIDDDMIHLVFISRIAIYIRIWDQVVLIVYLFSCCAIIDNHTKTLALCKRDCSHVIVKSDIGDIWTDPLFGKRFGDKLRTKRLFVQVIAVDTIMPIRCNHTCATLL